MLVRSVASLRRSTVALLAVVVSAAALSGCASARRADALELRHARDIERCTPRPIFPETIDEIAEPPLTARQLEALRLVPSEVRHVARAARLEADVAELVALRLEHLRDGVEPTVAEVLVRQRIQDRLRIVGIELTSTRFEVDCVGDQIEALLDRIHGHESRREWRQTIGSIAVGALAGIAAGVWELADRDSRAPAWIGVGGGTASAVLGVVAILPDGTRVLIEHDRNLLAPIATGDNSARVYGTFVWRLLDGVDELGREPRRLQILHRWSAFLDELVGRGPGRREAESALYGTGGAYDAELLELREGLFDILENEVDALNRELERLSRYLGRLDSALAVELGLVPAP